MYSEISEVIDASAESESVRVVNESNENENENSDAEESYPPQIPTTQDSKQHLLKTNSTQSEISVTGTPKSKFRQLANALFLESQEVEKPGWSNTQSQPELTNDHSHSAHPSINSQDNSTQSSFFIVRGDGKFDSSQLSNTQDLYAPSSTSHEEFEFDTDIDSLFLTQEEQRKKYLQFIFIYLSY